MDITKITYQNSSATMATKVTMTLTLHTYNTLTSWNQVPPKQNDGLEYVCSTTWLSSCLLTQTIQVNPLCTWLIGDRDMYLEEMLRGDGRGEGWKDEQGRAGCCGCDDGIGELRCLDCHGGHLSCTTCTIGLHALNPLHRIEVQESFLARYCQANKPVALEWFLLQAVHSQVPGSPDTVRTRSGRVLHQPNHLHQR